MYTVFFLSGKRPSSFAKLKRTCVSTSTFIYVTREPSTVTFIKQYKCQKVLIVSNFTEKTQKIVIPKEASGKLEVLLRNSDSSDEKQLGAYEARVFLVN